MGGNVLPPSSCCPSSLTQEQQAATNEIRARPLMEIKRNDGNCVQETLLQIYNIDVLTNNA
jgi:hypothetical protein